MKRHVIFNIVFPALAIVILAIGIAALGYFLTTSSAIPTENQLLSWGKKLDNNEFSNEQLTQIVRTSLATDRSNKSLHQAANDFLLAAAFAIIFFTGWLTIGCLKCLKINPEIGLSKAKESSVGE